ncbi:YadA family autotransporter adhesin, partial [Neisseria sp.]
DEQGNRVYPTGKKDADGNEIFNTKPDGSGQPVTGSVKTTVNGLKGTTTPTTLSNVEGNLDGAKTGTDAPTTSATAPTVGTGTGEVNKNNAATVGDVLNAGWNLQNNGEARDFVKPYDTVNFVNGKGTTAVVETADNLISTVKFDVDAGEITAETKDGKATGKVVGPVPADKKPADLLQAVADAQKAVDELAKDAAATPEAKKAAQDALKAAQAAAAPLNKVATAQNVADMINASGFTLKTSATAEGKKKSGDDEIINPGKTVEMVAGKNLTVTQDKNGKVTYATANNVNFNSLSLGISEHAPTLSADEDGSLRLGSKNNQAPVRISNVAPGIKDGDAVNVSQLKGVTKDLEDKIDGVAAGSNAAASLPQVYLPGKSMVAASVGTYGSQGALAVGYSSISDNGKWLIKGQINVNTKAKTGGGVGVGYLW